MAPRSLPIGTQVVTRVAVTAHDCSVRGTGSVGSVVAQIRAEGAGEPSYTVQFPDGGRADYGRDDLIVRAEAQWAPPHTATDLWSRVILSSVIGSQAYGLATDTSDVDRRGAYLAPAALDWSLRGAPEQLQDEDRQACFWELKKLLTLALKANPNALECLYSPLVEHVTPVGEDLLAIRSAFLSKVIYATYNGYALSQFKKMDADRRVRGEVNWKHAMHLLRALMAGIAALRDGHLPLDVGEHRDRLLAIRRGVVPWADVERWRLSLHGEFDRAVASTSLPDRPDYATVERFLISARQRAAREVGADDTG
jgi:uncharacterized protein